MNVCVYPRHKSLTAWMNVVMSCQGPAWMNAPGCTSRSCWGLRHVKGLQLRPEIALITGYFYGILHSINGVLLVFITGKGP